MAKELNDQNFEGEVIKFNGVVLVDFWAPWCTPCRMQGPIVEELSKDFADNEKVKITKVNVDENQGTAGKFQIMSIPTLKIFKNGNVVEDFVGVQSKDILTQKIKQHLA